MTDPLKMPEEPALGALAHYEEWTDYSHNLRAHVVQLEAEVKRLTEENRRIQELHLAFWETWRKKHAAALTADARWYQNLATGLMRSADARTEQYAVELGQARAALKDIASSHLDNSPKE